MARASTLLRSLVGAGDRIMGVTLPFALAGVAAGVLRPEWFRLDAGGAGRLTGAILLALGVPAWLASVALILIHVPKRRLITTGPFAVVRHPLYTSVALLVIPGLGLLLDSWIGLPIGAVLYAASRRYSPDEERALEQEFPGAYAAYRERVLLPWL